VHRGVLLLQYDELTRLGDWFAARQAELVEREAQERRADVVVTAPFGRDRQRERSHNQTELIARPLARRLGLKLERYLLARSRPRPSQPVLSRSERSKSVRGAYATHEGLKVDNLGVLLVDDVLTTGATVDGRPRALEKAGAAAIVGPAVARVGSAGMVRGSAVAAHAGRGQRKPSQVI
jgi:predicted amidophosphoribosyltransferase